MKVPVLRGWRNLCPGTYHYVQDKKFQSNYTWEYENLQFKVCEITYNTDAPSMELKAICEDMNQAYICNNKTSLLFWSFS
jgi:tRNA U34 5-methylaminomethyl-2-thiouridine-forming methyltransferase MnmC